MRPLGLSCNVKDGRLLVRGVAIHDGAATEVFRHRAGGSEDEALDLRELGDALSTRLADLDASAIVIRSADHHAAARISDNVCKRLRAEGVLLSVARHRCPIAVSLSGRGIGEALGRSKDEVKVTAAAIAPSGCQEATEAALAADHLAGLD